MIEWLREMWASLRLGKEAGWIAPTTVDPEVQKEWDEFWAPLVAPDGRIDLSQIKRELYDYSRLMKNASTVYEGVTGGKVSKITTDPQVILDLNEQVTQELIDEAVNNQSPRNAEWVKFQRQEIIDGIKDKLDKHLYKINEDAT